MVVLEWHGGASIYTLHGRQRGMVGVVDGDHATTGSGRVQGHGRVQGINAHVTEVFSNQGALSFDQNASRQSCGSGGWSSALASATGPWKECEHVWEGPWMVVILMAKGEVKGSSEATGTGR